MNEVLVVVIEDSLVEELVVELESKVDEFMEVVI